MKTQSAIRFFEAVEKGNIEKVKEFLLTKSKGLKKKILNSKNVLGDSPLHIAVTHNNYELTELLLNHKDTRVNVKNPFGLNPLHIAVTHNNYELTALLLDHKDTRVNVKNPFGLSPLHIAVTHSNYELTALLLDHEDIRVNLKSRSGLSPLDYAVEERFAEGTQLLLAEGANFDNKLQEKISKWCIKTSNKSLFMHALVVGMSFEKKKLPTDFKVIQLALKEVLEKKLGLTMNNTREVSSILQIGNRIITKPHSELSDEILEYREKTKIRHNISEIKQNTFFKLQAKIKIPPVIILNILDHIEGKFEVIKCLMENHELSSQRAHLFYNQLTDSDSELFLFWTKGRFSEEFFKALEQNNAIEASTAESTSALRSSSSFESLSSSTLASIYD